MNEFARRKRMKKKIIAFMLFFIWIWFAIEVGGLLK